MKGKRSIKVNIAGGSVGHGKMSWESPEPGLSKSLESGFCRSAANPKNGEKPWENLNNVQSGIKNKMFLNAK